MKNNWIRHFTLSFVVCALFSLCAHLLWEISDLGAHEPGRLFYTVILPLLFPLFLSIHWIAGRAGLPEASVERGARLDSLAYLTVAGFVVLGAGWEATGAFRLWAGVLFLFLLILKNGAVLRALFSAACSQEQDQADGTDPDSDGKEPAPGGFMLVGFSLAFLDAFAAGSWIALPFWNPAQAAGLNALLLLLLQLLSASALFALLVSAAFLLISANGFHPRASLAATLTLGTAFLLCGALTESRLVLFLSAVAVCAFSIAEIGDSGFRSRYGLPILLYSLILVSALSGAPPALFYSLLVAGILFLKTRDSRLVLPAVALALFLFLAATDYRPFDLHQYGRRLFELLLAFPEGLFTLCPLLLLSVFYTLFSRKDVGRLWAVFFLIYLLYLPMIRREGPPGEMMLRDVVPALAILGPPLAAAWAWEKGLQLGRAVILWSGAMAALILVLLPGIANPLFPPGVLSPAEDPRRLYVAGTEFWGFAVLLSCVFFAAGRVFVSPAAKRSSLAPAFVAILSILALSIAAAREPAAESTVIRPENGAWDLSAANPTLQVALPKSRSGYTRMTLISSLSRAASLRQGRSVGTIDAEESGAQARFPVRAGVETAEWSIDRPPLSVAAWRARPRHGRPRIESSYAAFTTEGLPFYGHEYRADFVLPAPFTEGELSIRLERPEVGWKIDAVVFSN